MFYMVKNYSLPSQNARTSEHLIFLKNTFSKIIEKLRQLLLGVSRLKLIWVMTRGERYFDVIWAKIFCMSATCRTHSLSHFCETSYYGFLPRCSFIYALCSFLIFKNDLASLLFSNPVTIFCILLIFLFYASEFFSSSLLFLHSYHSYF